MGAALKKKRPLGSLYVVLEKGTDDFIGAGFDKHLEEWFISDRLDPSRYRLVRFVPATKKATK